MIAPLRIGFIPLCDAAALLVAVDKGLCAHEGLQVDLIREVSWSNVRDKLNIGLFDAAHLLTPVAIALSLGLGHIKVPILAPMSLATNGNAITLSPSLHDALQAEAGAAPADPMQSAEALARLVARRKSAGEPPLTFGMTFPYSAHNYLLRFWMAAAGIHPDEDVHLVVLPPPYMVDSLANRHVDGFCVGAPWNSIAVDLGIGRVLHAGSDIIGRMDEKVLAVRQIWAEDNGDSLAGLMRALARAMEIVNDPAQRDEVCALLAAPNRVGVDARVIRRVLDGHLLARPGKPTRASDEFLRIGRDGAARPDPRHAAWLYAQMVRWGQAPLATDLLAAARAVFRPDIYDRVIASAAAPAGGPSDRIGAFTGPAFDESDLRPYLAAWTPRA